MVKLFQTRHSTTAEPFSCLVLILPVEERAAGIARRHEHQTKRRIERWRHPIGTSARVGTDLCALLTRKAARQQDRPPIGAEFFGPACLDEGLSVNQFSRDAIEHVEKA